MFVQMNAAEFKEAMDRRASGKPLSKSKGQKYSNKKVVTEEGITFDSRAEYRHWQHLTLLERAGEIRDLERQKVFVLAPAAVIGGRKKPALRYVADFAYTDKSGQSIVADTKGAITDVWRIKRHLMMTVHGIEVLEIRA